jgi:hypothetical protein
MWCWRRMEKISWTDCVRNDEVLQRVKEERNILHTAKRRKANWLGHILRRNCRLKHVTVEKIEGRIQVTGRRGRRCKRSLDGFKEKTGYCKRKEETME